MLAGLSAPAARCGRGCNRTRSRDRLTCSGHGRIASGSSGRRHGMAYGWQAETWGRLAPARDWRRRHAGANRLRHFPPRRSPLLLTLTEPSGPVRGLILTSSPGLPRRRREMHRATRSASPPCCGRSASPGPRFNVLLLIHLTPLRRYSSAYGVSQSTVRRGRIDELPYIGCYQATATAGSPVR